MKRKTILSVLIVLFSYLASYSQDYLIVKTLAGDDSNAFTILRYGRKDYGFGVVSSKGVMNWQVPLPGFIIGMGKFNGNVLVFYTTDNPASLTIIKDIHAALIGLKEKKIVTDKLIYTNETGHVIDPSVLNDPGGNFVYLFIRTTALKRGIGMMANKADEKMNETEKMNLVSFDKTLDTHTKELKSNVSESSFLAACQGISDDTYISSFANDQVITEKFDGDGDVKGKIAVNDPLRTKKKYFPIIKYDSIQVNCVDLAIAYSNNHKDDVLRLFRFDFNDQKAYATDETILNKDYVKQLEKTGSENSRLSNFKSIDDLYPVQILETGDKVIVLKEIQYSFTPSGDNAEQFFRNGNIISIYTKKDLHVERDIIIDKSFGTFILGGTAICSHMKGGKLYTVTCELTSPGQCKTFLYIVNINDGSIEKKVLEKEDAGKGWTTDPTTILWFSNNFITPFTSGKAFIHLKFETDLQSENY